jgi:hypothetical protein
MSCRAEAWVERYESWIGDAGDTADPKHDHYPDTRQAPECRWILTLNRVCSQWKKPYLLGTAP